MKETKLEQEALQLSPEERADLAAKPSLSLETDLEEDDAGHWLREARQRADEIDDGRVKLVPANEVRSKVMELIG